MWAYVSNNNTTPQHSIMNTIAHTRTHTFNGLFSRTTQVSRYQKGKTNVDFTEARDSEWQWHQLGHMQVCTSLQTDNHASTLPLKFLQAGRPSCHPTNSVKALKAQIVQWWTELAHNHHMNTNLYILHQYRLAVQKSIVQYSTKHSDWCVRVDQQQWYRADVWQYLSETLGEYVGMVMESTDNFEVDPSVAGSSSSSSVDLRRRRDRLTESCRLVWYKIVNSQAQLPL